MRAKLKTALLAALLASPLATFAMTNVPTTCPSVESIKQVPFTTAQVDYWIGWIAVSPTSKYDTQVEWTKIMMLGRIGDDEDEAIAVKKANSALPFIYSAAGPEKQQDAYWCAYYLDKDQNTSILAVTPAHESLGKKLAKLQRFK